MRENWQERLDAIGYDCLRVNLYNFTRPISARSSWELATRAEEGKDIRRGYRLSGRIHSIRPSVTLLEKEFYIPKIIVEDNKWKRTSIHRRPLVLLLDQDDANSIGLEIQMDEKELENKVLYVKMDGNQKIDAIMNDPSFRGNVKKYSHLLIKSCMAQNEISKRIRIKKGENVDPTEMEAFELAHKLIEMYALQMGLELSTEQLIGMISPKQKNLFKELFDIDL